MNSKNELLKNEIGKFLKIKDFDLLLSLFRENKFSIIDLLIFYKRKSNKNPDEKNPLKYTEFWKSKLPEYYLDNIIESDIGHTFFEEYFSLNERCNHELNRHLLQISFDHFIKFFKFTRAYKHSDFMKSLKDLIPIYSQLEKVLIEFDAILRIEDKIQDQEMLDNDELVKFSLGEVLMAFTLYYYKFKQSPVIASNKSYQTQFEMALVEEIIRIINIFKSNGDIDFCFKTNSELQKEFELYRVPHFILGKEHPSVPLKESYQELFELINKMISRKEYFTIIEMYLMGYSDIEKELPSSLKFKTNENFKVFQINNSKSPIEEHYFMSFSFDSLGKKLPQKTDVACVLNNFQFLGIPLKINSGTIKLNLKTVVTFLQHYSKFKGPEKRTFISQEKYIVNNEGNDKFAKYFRKNESITLINYNKLIEGLSSYANIEVCESKQIIDYLSYDLQGSEYCKNWLYKPFLRNGDNVLWLGSFLIDRRWSNIIINNLKENSNRLFEYKSWKMYQTDKQDLTLSRIFELQVEKAFHDQGFVTEGGLKFKTSDGQSGDFDVLAYKHNFLFVCEVKSGKRSDEYGDAAFYENIRLENTAAFQLEKSNKKINEDWPLVKRSLKLPENIELEDITIYPLIITDYFEGDLRIYKNLFKKISLLELEVIFKNNKEKLLKLYFLNQQFRNSNNPNYIRSESEINKVNWDLWNGFQKLSIHQLINCIEKNLIWNELETHWMFEQQEYRLDK